MKNIYFKIQEAKKNNEQIAICTIVNTKGSTPRKVGAKMIVYANGKIYGTIGGGELEKTVIKDALNKISHGEAQFFRHDLLHHHNMCCGGTVDIFIEPIMKNCKLYIFGAGHTGQALARLANNLDFEIFMIDERAEYINDCKLPEVNKLTLDYLQSLKILPFDENTYVCVMTHNHKTDREILAYCIKQSYAYLGMIGSRRKVEVTKKMFTEAGFVAEEILNKVDMPMGVDIGAEGPEEIALSILAKLVSVKNKVRKCEKELQL